MSDIIVLDSSDDEEKTQLNKKNCLLPVIVNVESLHNVNSNNRKRSMTRQIGECVLSPIKKSRNNNSFIEISDDSDDNSRSINNKKKGKTVVSVPKELVENISNKSITEAKPIKNESEEVISLLDDSPIKTENHKQSAGNGLEKTLPSRVSGIDPLHNESNGGDSQNNQPASSNHTPVPIRSILILPSTSLPNKSKIPVESNGECSSKNNKIASSSSELFETFLKACESVDTSDDMKKVILKLKKYYNSANSGYRESDPFLKLLRRTTRLVQLEKNYYMHIKDFIEELRIRRDDQTETNDTEDSSAREIDDYSQSTGSGSENKIHKLQCAMKKINSILKRLDEQEVDFDDDADSVYIMKDKYERRLVKIYNKLCSITGEKPCAGRAIKRKFSMMPGPRPAINRRIEEFINKKKQFPDFHDVMNVVKKCNEEFDYKMSLTAIENEARNIFQKVGTELQRRRKADYYLSISDYLDTADPASEDPELLAKLEKNRIENKHKITDIINKYVEQADQLGLKEEEVKTDEENKSDAEGESSDEDSMNGSLVSTVQTKDSDTDLCDTSFHKDEIDSKENSPSLINKDVEEAEKCHIAKDLKPNYSGIIKQNHIS